MKHDQRRLVYWWLIFAIFFAFVGFLLALYSDGLTARTLLAQPSMIVAFSLLLVLTSRTPERGAGTTKEHADVRTDWTICAVSIAFSLVSAVAAFVL